MILILMLDTIGGFLSAIGLIILFLKHTRPMFWQSIRNEERREGDGDKAIVILLVIGLLMICAGVSLAKLI